MAAGGLFDVSGNEPRPIGPGRTLCGHEQPQFRRAPGQGGQDTPDVPRDGRRRRCNRTPDRRKGNDERDSVMHDQDEKTPRLYRYVIVTDGGDAPCTKDDLLTLATCKPVIRRLARVGDWVAAFRGQAKRNGEHAGALVWAGRIGETVGWDDYVKRFPSRFDARYSTSPFPDAQGQPCENSTWFRKRGGYHTDAAQQERDFGHPILVFDMNKTWYFGEDPKQLSGELCELVARNQGHRINHPRHLTHAFFNWAAQFPAGIIGKHPDDEEACKICGSEPVYSPPKRQSPVAVQNG